MEPVVLIHGAGGASWHDFAPLIPYLEQRRSILVLRTPGSYDAASLEPGADLTMEAFADRLETMLDDAGLERPDIIGESTGGWLALELARRDRARAVVAISPGGMWAPDEARQVERDLRRATALARRMLPVTSILVSTAPGRHIVFSPLLGSRGAELSADEARHVLRALVDSRLALDVLDANKDESGDLRRADGMSEVRCPVLVIWGSNDRLLPVVQANRWQEALDRVEVEQLEGVGHHPHFDRPEEVARLALDFFEGAAGASQP